MACTKDSRRINKVKSAFVVKREEGDFIQSMGAFRIMMAVPSNPENVESHRFSRYFSVKKSYVDMEYVENACV